MFINKAKDGNNNISGKNIAKFRKELNISQRELADRLQLTGLDIDKNGKRFVTDVELVYFSEVLDKTLNELLFC